MSVAPGLTALMRTVSLMWSRAATLVRVLTAAFDAVQAARTPRLDGCLAGRGDGPVAARPAWFSVGSAPPVVRRARENECAHHGGEGRAALPARKGPGTPTGRPDRPAAPSRVRGVGQGCGVACGAQVTSVRSTRPVSR
ncbi:hypothetical protein GCM10010499_08490 [Streptomyces thermoviolaceus subsp. apingens]|nr:hypothetical protein GCM10010499_08490 [Streptomyces thermoviolaceus subsp. apingens]